MPNIDKVSCSNYNKTTIPSLKFGRTKKN